MREADIHVRTSILAIVYDLISDSHNLFNISQSNYPYNASIYYHSHGDTTTCYRVLVRTQRMSVWLGPAQNAASKGSETTVNGPCTAP